MGIITKTYTREYLKTERPELYEKKRAHDAARQAAINADPDKLLVENNRKWLYSQTEYAKARSAERSKEWVDANPERALENQRRWQRENREKLKAYSKKYHSSLKGLLKLRMAASLRRARLRNCVCTLTDEQVLGIFAAWKHRCAYCKSDKKKLTIDHVVPISRQGDHAATNVVPACLSCNSTKHANPLPPAVEARLLMRAARIALRL